VTGQLGEPVFEGHGIGKPARCDALGKVRRTFRVLYILNTMGR